MATEEDQVAEFHASVVRVLPRNLPPEVRKAWIGDPSGLRAALEGALTLNGISTPAPKVQQITFLVRLNYDETIPDKLDRGEFTGGGGRLRPDYDNHGFDDHGKKGSKLVVARLVKIEEELQGRDKVIERLDSLKLRPGIAAELADCALGGHLAHEKIGRVPVVALGDIGNLTRWERTRKEGTVNRWSASYHESMPDLAGKVHRVLDTGVEHTCRFCPNEWWYLAFQK